MKVKKQVIYSFNVVEEFQGVMELFDWLSLQDEAIKQAMIAKPQMMKGKSSVRSINIRRQLLNYVRININKALTTDDEHIKDIAKIFIIKFSSVQKKSNNETNTNTN